VSESPYRTSRGGVLVEGVGEGIAGTWNAVLMYVPLMRQWTAEQFMARVSNVEGIDLDWRNYLRERYDV